MQQNKDAFGVTKSATDIIAQASRLKKSIRDRSQLSIQARIDAFDELSKSMLSRDERLTEYLRRPGVAFLAGFLQRSNMENLLQREFPNPAALQHFVPCGGRKSVRIVPRGLACHWLAGNVPLLGALSWSISALVGNANLLRLSSRQEDPIGPLLSVLKTVSEVGAKIADETGIVRFDREDTEAHAAMSEKADIRIAWGGKEAIEAVRNLSSSWDCEDLILGPRTSIAVIEPRSCSTQSIQRLASDITMFDQQACSSPQLVFVQTDECNHLDEDFLQLLESALDAASKRFTRHSLDAGETYRIVLDRSRAILEGGRLKRDLGTEWTIAILPKPDLNIRCVNRFIQLIPFNAIDEIMDHIPSGIQTVVTSLNSEQHSEFTEKASHLGVCRFPTPGEGNFFESPWDGIPIASRLTRWVTRSTPNFSSESTT